MARKSGLASASFVILCVAVYAAAVPAQAAINQPVHVECNLSPDGMLPVFGLFSVGGNANGQFAAQISNMSISSVQRVVVTDESNGDNYTHLNAKLVFENFGGGQVVWNSSRALSVSGTIDGAMLYNSKAMNGELACGFAGSGGVFTVTGQAENDTLVPIGGKVLVLRSDGTIAKTYNASGDYVFSITGTNVKAVESASLFMFPAGNILVNMKPGKAEIDIGTIIQGMSGGAGGENELPNILDMELLNGAIFGTLKGNVSIESGNWQDVSKDVSLLRFDSADIKIANGRIVVDGKCKFAMFNGGIYNKASVVSIFGFGVPILSFVLWGIAIAVMAVSIIIRPSKKKRNGSGNGGTRQPGGAPSSGNSNPGNGSGKNGNENSSSAASPRAPAAASAPGKADEGEDESKARREAERERENRDVKSDLNDIMKLPSLLIHIALALIAFFLFDQEFKYILGVSVFDAMAATKGINPANIASMVPLIFGFLVPIIWSIMSLLFGIPVKVIASSGFRFFGIARGMRGISKGIGDMAGTYLIGSMFMLWALALVLPMILGVLLGGLGGGL